MPFETTEVEENRPVRPRPNNITRGHPTIDTWGQGWLPEGDPYPPPTVYSRARAHAQAQAPVEPAQVPIEQVRVRSFQRNNPFTVYDDQGMWVLRIKDDGSVQHAKGILPQAQALDFWRYVDFYGKRLIEQVRNLEEENTTLCRKIFELEAKLREE